MKIFLGARIYAATALFVTFFESIEKHAMNDLSSHQQIAKMAMIAAHVSKPI